jgi:predicted metal-dependent phosphoesterase TrpH
MSGGPRLDLHVHTRGSRDSSLTPEAAVRQALVEGLEGIAVTDHNTLSAIPAAREAARGAAGFLIIPGVEVTTAEGHLLVYGVERVPRSHRPLAETIDEARRLGGVPVLAHPFRWIHGAGEKAARTLPVMGIEVMNGRNPEIANARAGVVAAARRLAATGGSDAHESKSVGRCCTVCEGPASSVDEVLELLRQGRVHAEGKGQGLGGRFAISLANAGKRLARGGAEA